jgi:hypothetical protein
MTCELLTYSQEPAAASWPTSSSVTPLSSPSSGSPTPAKSCASDSPACESSRAMSEPWTSRESWLASMQSALVFLVRTSAQQEKAQALEASEAASTARSCEQLTLFDLPGCSSKTVPSSEPEAGTSSSPTWWREDIPGETDSLPRLMSERLISAIGGGASGAWPTPSANEFHTKDAEALIARRERCKATAKNGNGFGLTLGNAITLAAAGKWPTPVASDWRSGLTSEATASKNSRPLREKVMWRTPSAHVIDPKSSVVKLTGRKPSDPQVGLADQVGGQLNPAWVEWLMGWPIGHTESKHWATAKSRSKRPTPGSRSAVRGKG